MAVTVMQVGIVRVPMCEGCMPMQRGARRARASKAGYQQERSEDATRRDHKANHGKSATRHGASTGASRKAPRDKWTMARPTPAPR